MDKYILDGHTLVPVDLMTWAKWFGKADRHVARTVINDKVRVSTIFLGINLRFGDGPPLVFETMAFRDGEETDCDRYATWDEAQRGHDEMVAKYSVSAAARSPAASE